MSVNDIAKVFAILARLRQEAGGQSSEKSEFDDMEEIGVDLFFSLITTV